jgi:hypothetical protein
MANWKVGDLVVCVSEPEDKYGGGYAGPSRDRLRLRAVYKITGIVTGYDGETRRALGFQLAGMNPAPYRGYHSECFRPVTKADEQFTARIRACRPAHRKTPVLT